MLWLHASLFVKFARHLFIVHRSVASQQVILSAVGKLLAKCSCCNSSLAFCVLTLALTVQVTSINDKIHSAWSLFQAQSRN